MPPRPRQEMISDKGDRQENQECPSIEKHVVRLLWSNCNIVVLAVLRSH
jgi:hypothetical protein